MCCVVIDTLQARRDHWTEVDPEKPHAQGSIGLHPGVEGVGLEPNFGCDDGLRGLTARSSSSEERGGEAVSGFGFTVW